MPALRGRKAETQERIVAAAISLFAARGYERTSVSAVASRAGISRSAVFWHFGDKESLFREAFRRTLAPLEEFRAGLSHADPRERLLAALAAYELVVEEHEGTVRSMVRWLLESESLRSMILDTLFELHDQFISDLGASLAELQRESDDATPLAAALVSLLDGNFLLDMLDPSSHNRERRRAGLRLLAGKAFGDVDGE